MIKYYNYDELLLADSHLFLIACLFKKSNCFLSNFTGDLLIFDMSNLILNIVLLTPFSRRLPIGGDPNACLLPSFSIFISFYHYYFQLFLLYHLFPNPIQIKNSSLPTVRINCSLKQQLMILDLSLPTFYHS